MRPNNSEAISNVIYYIIVECSILVYLYSNPFAQIISFLANRVSSQTAKFSSPVVDHFHRTLWLPVCLIAFTSAT